jgi:hypothetical protein
LRWSIGWCEVRSCTRVRQSQFAIPANEPATPVTEPMLCRVSGRGFVTATNPAAKRHCAR